VSIITAPLVVEEGHRGKGNEEKAQEVSLYASIEGLARLRREILRYVNQEPVLFNQSITENMLVSEA
jgi:hypothetical protein